MANDTINNIAARSAPAPQPAQASQVKQADTSGGKPVQASADQAAKSTPPSQQELSAAVAELNSQLQTVERNLQFSIDDASGQTVVKVLNSETKELIRQIPSEELLRISERIKEQQESNPGLIFEISA